MLGMLSFLGVVLERYILMTASARIKGLLEILGLGQDVSFPFNAPTGTTPTRKNYGYRQQAAADQAEALDLGGVSTTQLLVIKAVSKAIYVDLDFSSAFDEDLVIPEGETAIIPKPAGTVYVKNYTSSEQATYEYWVTGV